ncbi:N-acetylmuramoyl-L-alanine amidase [Cylindrospermopsis raciborskii]|uniref:N-acetylmuramoyl-L-alanine amidase n=1 Tax=Cylindrospermopsis raciborskii TaxID=77022 RepID=UPI003AF31BB2
MRKLINPKTESGGSFQVKTGFNAGIPINILYGVLPQNYFNARSITPPSDSINNRQKKVVRKYITTDKFSKYQPRLAAAQVHPSNYGERFSWDTKGMAVSNQPIIVLHETTYSASSAINYFQNHNVDEDIQASYHAIIARDGTVIYLVPPDKRAFGAGNSVFKNTDGTIETVQTNPKLAPSVDNFAYHVSLETPPDGWGKRNIREHSGYTQEQYNSLAWLIAQSQVPDERITTHRSVDVANGKVDPLSFDFDRFFKKLHSFRKLHSIAQSHS